MRPIEPGVGGGGVGRGRPWALGVGLGRVVVFREQSQGGREEAPRGN